MKDTLDITKEGCRIKSHVEIIKGQCKKPLVEITKEGQQKDSCENHWGGTTQRISHGHHRRGMMQERQNGLVLRVSINNKNYHPSSKLTPFQIGFMG